METQITDGKINLRGNMAFREKPKRADYLLYLSANNPIAVIEAKDNNHTVSHGPPAGDGVRPKCWTCPLRSVLMVTVLPSTTFSPAQSGNSVWMSSHRGRTDRPVQAGIGTQPCPGNCDRPALLFQSKHLSAPVLPADRHQPDDGRHRPGPAAACCW